MSSSDSESTYSDAGVKSDVGSPVIQDLDIIMVTDATVGSGDDETNAVGKTVQMTATNSSKTDAEGNSTQITAAKSSRTDPDGKTTQMIATNSSSASASTADRSKKKSCKWDAPDDAQEKKSPTSKLSR